VKELGKLPASNQAATLVDGLFGAQSLVTLGQPGKFELTSGQAQGTFNQVPGQQAPVPAVVTNTYGQGRSLLFAFDLAAMLTADVVLANTQLAGFVSTSASHATSGTPTLTIGDVTVLASSVSNQGTRTVAFRAEATVPAGLALMTVAPAATQTANTDGSTGVTWNFSLAGGATRDLLLQLRVQQAGAFSLPLAIYSLPAPGSTLPPKLRFSGSASLEAKDAASLLHQALVEVTALQPSASADKSDRTKAVNAASQALTLHNQGNYEAALAQWLAAVDAVIGIASVDTSAARSAISLAMEASTDALCVQRCGSAACQ
jgi:hypothetical protein